MVIQMFSHNHIQVQSVIYGYKADYLCVIKSDPSIGLCGFWPLNLKGDLTFIAVALTSV